LKIIFLLFLCINLHAEARYWQQELDYKIDVQLNDRNNTLNGNLELVYKNNSGDTLHYIWFHLWPNAYKDFSTPWARQLRKEFSAGPVRTEKGYIENLDFKVDGSRVRIAYAPESFEMVQLLLSEPLLPGKSVRISTPFVTRLPKYTSRSGYSRNQFFICQWYPKPAVYDRKGWHPMPYLEQGEFYSEFGNFEVNITLPAQYVVGASGIMTNNEELEMYREIGRNNNSYKKYVFYKNKNEQKLKTLNFKADSVHDFAWFANKHFVIRYDTLMLSSKKSIDVFSFSRSFVNSSWNNSTKFIKDAVIKYSSWIGEYPYPVVAAVEGPENNSSGGMEYPMITLITSPHSDTQSLDALIAHEVGHNWFYGIVGSNERNNPWMDEGINTFFAFRYEAEKYRSNSSIWDGMQADYKHLSTDEFLNRMYRSISSYFYNTPISTESTGFANKGDYGFVVYTKTAQWMHMLQQAMGKEKFDAGIKHYYNTWKFRHPYPEDFKQAMEEASDLNLDDMFNLLKKRGNF
jgi:uncharacterized protein YjaZ